MEGRGSRTEELLEGKMDSTLGLDPISTRRQKIAKLAREARGLQFTTLAHHLDLAWMQAALAATRKNGATGVDGMTAAEYAQGSEDRLRGLLERAKSGTYIAPPVKRVYVPKDVKGQMRPIGIPTYEDKVLQRAVVMLLEPIYEQDFLPCSYGFRPGRSAHDALQALRNGLMEERCRWVVDVDIAQFFDSIDHRKLREILSKRVRDGVIVRLIGKWLNAGVLEKGEHSYPEEGTPQGGVISPLLANIFLHEVVDAWVARELRPRLGKVLLVRYADDLVIGVGSEAAAKEVLLRLGQRLEEYGLKLHPEKTRLVNLEPPWRNDNPDSFDFLGFTFYWGQSRKGNWVIRLKTAAKRLKRTITRIGAWARKQLHNPLREQQKGLNQKLMGHYGYFGITGNFRALEQLFRVVVKVWKRWLGRRSQRANWTWEKHARMLEKYPLCKPRIVHRYGT